MKPLPERPSPRWDPMKIYDQESAGPETTLPGGAPLLGPVYDELQAPPGTSQPTMGPDEDLRPGDQRRPFPDSVSGRLGLDAEIRFKKKDPFLFREVLARTMNLNVLQRGKKKLSLGQNNIQVSHYGLTQYFRNISAVVTAQGNARILDRARQEMWDTLEPLD
eukprot:g60238.t1